MPLSPWLARALLLCLVLGGGAYQFAGRPPQTRRQLAERTRAELVRAGFAATVQTESWLDGKLKGGVSLVARHPVCREPIVLTLSSLEAPIHPGAGGATTYIYGGLRTHTRHRLELAAETARLEVGSTLSWGRVLRPARIMLVAADPSACLTLTDLHWAGIWEQPAPPSLTADRREVVDASS